MIILRDKNYSRRDILPKSEWFTEDPDINKENLRIDIEPSKNKR